MNHHKTCSFCLDELLTINKVYINGRVYKYCIECMNELKNAQSSGYINSLKRVKCETDLIALLQKGLSTYIRDQGEIVEVYYGWDGTIYSGKLSGGLSVDDTISLNYKFKRLSESMCNPASKSIDYIDELNAILTEFDL